MQSITGFRRRYSDEFHCRNGERRRSMSGRNVRRMPYGRCFGCGDDSFLPPSFHGYCFLCFTDGPPGTFTQTFGATNDQDDGLRLRMPFVEDDLSDLTLEVREEFAAAQVFQSSRAHVDFLGKDVNSRRFSISRSPNIISRGRWLNRRSRIDPIREIARMRRHEAAREKARVRAERDRSRLAAVTSTVVETQSRPRGRPRQVDSALSRAAAFILGHPGTTIEDVASALKIPHRQAARNLYVCQEQGRVLRVGPHGQSRFYPGPRAVIAIQEQESGSSKNAVLNCVITEAALSRLELLARARNCSLGEIVEMFLTRDLSDAAVPICDAVTIHGDGKR